MENKNQRVAGQNSDAQDQWLNADHQGDWQLAESSEQETDAEMLTAQSDREDKSPLYATGDDPDEENTDDEENEADAADWGNTDPLSTPLPDPMDPSGPGSAV